MPRPKRLVTTAAEIKAVDFDQVEELALKGFRNLPHFAAELGISLAALYDRRDTDAGFRAQMDEAIARGHARTLGKALEMLWAKALEGDRAAIIKFVDRLDPELATTLMQQRQKGVSITDSDVVVLTGKPLQDRLAQSREQLRLNRERMFVESDNGPEP